MAVYCVTGDLGSGKSLITVGLMRDYGYANKRIATSMNIDTRNMWPETSDIMPGFLIEDCGSAGHKIARPPAVSLIEYPNYNCGHNKGETVKRPYIKKLHKFVKQHEEAIKEYLK